MVTFSGVRSLGNFVRARIHRLFKSVEDFVRESGIGKPTVYRVLDAVSADDLSSHGGTLEVLAEKLSFREWEDLLGAWRANDVRRDLGTVYVPLPRADYDRIAARAAEDGYTDVARYIIRVMTPKEWVFKGGPDADDAGQPSSPRLPPEPGETSEAPTEASKRGRPPAQAR